MMLSLQCDVNTAESLQGLRDRSELCDVVIVSSDGRQTPAHSCVLASHSTVIATVLQSRLAAEHDWSILRPLVINIDEVSVKNSAKQELGGINIVEILISLMYGEIVNVSDMHVPALNEYAHVLGLSDQIFTCLDEGKNFDFRNKKYDQTTLQAKNNRDEYEHVEVLSEINLAHQMFPADISKSSQEKQSADDAVIESFDGKSNPENVLSFSMLCSESQDDDSSGSKTWNDGALSYDKHRCMESQDCNVIVCKLEQDGIDKSGGTQMTTLAKDKNIDSNICSVTNNPDGVLNITVSDQAHANTFCMEGQQLHQQKKQPKKSFICSACGSAFQKCGDLVKHIQNMQHFTVQCPLCFIQVEDFEGQRLHFALHDQPLPFFCVYCDLRFRTRAALTMHTPKHMTSKPFVCNDCGRGFKWRHALHAHLHTHSTTSRLLCDICGFSSKYVTSFKAHLLQHSGQSFPCPHPGCSFTSNRKTHLNDHLATHSKTRVHQCEVCGHSFSHARNMRRHMRLHAPASNLLTCVSLSKLQCNFRTTRPDKLRDHLFRKHSLKHDTLPSKHISKLLKSSTVIPGDHPSMCNKDPMGEYPSEDNVQLTGPRTFRSCMPSPKARSLPVIESCAHNSVEVSNLSVDSTGNISFQTSCGISNEVKIEGIDSMKNDNEVLFDPSQHNGDDSEEHFSVLISSPGMVELPEIQTLQTHAQQSVKDEEVSEITDNFHSGFLIENDILLEKTESTGMPDSCLVAKGDMRVLQPNVLPVSTQKVMSVNPSVDVDQFGVMERHDVNSLPYSSHCTLAKSQDDIILEVADSSTVELPSTSSVQASVSDSIGNGDFQESSVKEEQCMESLTILEFMLDNVTS